MSSHIAGRPIVRAMVWLVALMLLGFCMIQSLQVAVEWWYDRLPAPGLREWIWLLLLPVLVGIYLRYFSIFRPDCQACQLPESTQNSRRHE